MVKKKKIEYYNLNIYLFFNSLSDAECFECELKENVVLNHITMKCECEKGF